MRYAFVTRRRRDSIAAVSRNETERSTPVRNRGIGHQQCAQRSDRSVSICEIRFLEAVQLERARSRRNRGEIVVLISSAPGELDYFLGNGSWGSSRSGRCAAKDSIGGHEMTRGNMNEWSRLPISLLIPQAPMHRRSLRISAPSRLRGELVVLILSAPGESDYFFFGNGSWGSSRSGRCAAKNSIGRYDCFFRTEK